MPTLSKSLPRYHKHRASGQAVVTIAGTGHYLGPYSSATSRREYDRLVSEWLVRGRTPAPDPDPARHRRGAGVVLAARQELLSDARR